MVGTASAAQQPLPNVGGKMDGQAVQSPQVNYFKGNLWSNGQWDHQAMLASEEIFNPNGTIAWYAYTVDDFEVPANGSPFTIDEIRATLVTNDPDPIHARAEIWSDCGDPFGYCADDWGDPGDILEWWSGPSYQEKTWTESTTRYQIGFWVPPCCPGETFYVYEWHFYPTDLMGGPFILGAGRYWLKVVGLAELDRPWARFYWASSGMGNVQDYMGQFQSDHFEFYCPNWFSSLYVIGYATDFAFDVDGTSLPGKRMHVSDITHLTKPRLFPPRWEVINTVKILPDGGTKGVRGAFVDGCLYPGQYRSDWGPDTVADALDIDPPAAWVDINGNITCATKVTNSAGVATFRWEIQNIDGFVTFCVYDRTDEATYVPWLVPYNVMKAGGAYNYVNNKCYDKCSELTCMTWDLSCDCPGGNDCGW
jgi:hypothetical protein